MCQSCQAGKHETNSPRRKPWLHTSWQSLNNWFVFTRVMQLCGKVCFVFFFVVAVAKRNTNDRRIDAAGQNSCYMIRRPKTLADIIFASVLVSVDGKFPFRSKKSRAARRRPRRRSDVFSTVTPLMPSYATPPSSSLAPLTVTKRIGSSVLSVRSCGNRII